MTDTLDKVVVAQLLDAVKGGLSHLSELKIALAETEHRPAGADDHRVLQLYSRVRRIREYLRRTMSAYPLPEALDLGDDDVDLLCSCMILELHRSEKGNTPQETREGKEVDWYEKRKEILSNWIIKLATKPIELLPTLWNRQELSYDARQVVAAVREKTTELPEPTTNPSGILRFGNSSIDEELPGRDAPVAAESRTTPSESATSLVDTSRIQDYRLRLTMVLDIRAYQRCIEGEDHRLAIVLLAMILEGLLVDHGLTHQDELGLEGAPASWELEGIVEAILESDYDDRARAAYALLQRAQGLLHPTSQLDEPIAVNKAMLEPVEALVRRVGAAIGVSGTGSKSGGTWSINWES